MLLTRVPDVTVVKKFTATNTNMLSGTQLETVPVEGDLVLAIASTVDTATFSLTSTGQQAANADDVIKSTDGVPLLTSAPHYKLHLPAQGKPTAVLAGTTGTVFLVAMFFAGRA